MLPGQEYDSSSDTTVGGTTSGDRPRSRQICRTKASAKRPDLAYPLAQRGDGQGHAVQPKEEVLAKVTASDFRLQVPVGGGDETRVDVPRLDAAQACHLAGFDDPQ